MSEGVDAYGSQLALKAAQLKSNGISFVARYYSQSPNKALSLTEAIELTKAGIYIVTVYEDNPTNDSYWSAERGFQDAKRYVAQAASNGQPAGSAAYYAVDYDLQPNVYDALFAYAEQFQIVVKTAGYIEGAYGSGAVLEALLNRGNISKAWLAQSQGWSGYDSFYDSGKASLIQHMPAVVAGVSVDPDTSSGSAGGWLSNKV